MVTQSLKNRYFEENVGVLGIIKMLWDSIFAQMILLLKTRYFEENLSVLGIIKMLYDSIFAQ